jgi:ankyrin repeat protein
MTAKLRSAIKGGRVNECINLIHAGADPYATNRLGRDALTLACLYGQNKCLQALFDHGFILDPIVKHRNSMIDSAYFNYTRCGEILLKHGASVDMSDTGGATVLMHAVSKNSTNFIRFLLKNNVNINQKTHFGNTALHYAAIYCNIDSMELLMKHGAYTDVQNLLNDTPLHWAAYKGYTNACRILLQRGASPRIKGENGLLAVETAKLQGNHFIEYQIDIFHKRYVFDILLCFIYGLESKLPRGLLDRNIWRDILKYMCV